jgi:hypothetical protein
METIDLVFIGNDGLLWFSDAKIITFLRPTNNLFTIAKDFLRKILIGACIANPCT